MLVMLASLVLFPSIHCGPPTVTQKTKITFILTLPSSKVELSAIALGMDPDGSLFDDAGHFVFDASREAPRSIRKLFYANPDRSPRKLDIYLRDEKSTSLADLAENLQRLSDAADNQTYAVIYIRLGRRPQK
jgi:hypothetical protein